MNISMYFYVITSSTALYLGVDMMDRQRFRYALMLSFLIHCCLIIGLSLPRHYHHTKPAKQIEVVYRAVKQKAIEDHSLTSKKFKVMEDVPPPLDDIDIISKNDDFFRVIDKQIADVTISKDTLKLANKQTDEIRTLDMDRKITIPVLKTEKMISTGYLSQHQKIREKIRQRAYAYINNPRLKDGQVYLTFLLNRDGRLKQVKIIESKTRANAYTRLVAKRSVEEASPFPPFPDDLQYPELSFSIMISFRVNE